MKQIDFMRMTLNELQDHILLQEERIGELEAQLAEAEKLSFRLENDNDDLEMEVRNLTNQLNGEI